MADKRLSEALNSNPMDNKNNNKFCIKAQTASR